MSANLYLTAPHVLLPTGPAPVWLRIENGHISAVESTPQADLPHYVLPSGWLCPGYIDVQVNGGGGVFFNSTPTVSALAQISQAHRRFGSTALLPTVISAELSVMRQAADAVAAAIAAGEPGIIGIHFEGPHLSISKRGCHPPAQLRPLSDAELALYCRSDIGVRMVTVAPEAVPAAQIRQLCEAGVIVALGHSNATATQVEAALAAGASGFTHLYNGMSGLSAREPGMTGIALSASKAYCGIILDGEHVHPACARLAWLAKGSNQLALVTDAMSPVGTSQQRFQLAGGWVQRDGFKLTNENGSLAGSVLDMQSAVNYACQQLGIALTDALQMASQTPARWLGLADRGVIAAGARADLLWLDAAHETTATSWQLKPSWQLKQCWLAGQAQQPDATQPALL
jgi:N-acetylglucosamine-6-phosphate deacetylase